MDVSIIIVNWNTKELLQNCLKSLYDQTSRVDYEVIVIDNNSNDGSIEMMQQVFPEVTLIRNSQNLGFAAANNQGIRIATGQYVLLLNSDTLVMDNAIAKTVHFANAKPEAAIFGCRVLNSNGSLQSSCFMFPSIINLCLYSTYLYKLFPRSKFFGRELLTWWNKCAVREVDCVSGCFMLIRREAINQVGLMDEQFFMYFEETDWCYRFKQKGWKVLFTPEAEIIHLGGGSAKQVPVKTTLLLRGSMLQYFKKHDNFFIYIAACMLIALFFLVRIPYWLIMALTSKKQNKKNCLLTAYAYTIGTWYTLKGGENLSREGRR